MRLKNHLLKLALLPAIALALVVGACSQDATESNLTSPEQADFARNGNGTKSFRRLDVTNAAPMHVTADVGASGAILRADQYFLLIPAGAVRTQTTFTMDVGTDGLVSLMATTDRNGIRTDVGANGFRKPLTLALYFGQSPEAQANASKLQVGWVRDNGSLAPVPSTVNAEVGLVYGSLQHFSKYSLIFPDTGDEYP